MFWGAPRTAISLLVAAAWGLAGSRPACSLGAVQGRGAAAGQASLTQDHTQALGLLERIRAAVCCSTVRRWRSCAQGTF